jgi:hypothetical protein
MTVINREQTTFQKCESPSGLFDKLRLDEPRGVVVQRGLAPATIVVAPDPGETVVIDPKLGTVLKFAFSLEHRADRKRIAHRAAERRHRHPQEHVAA